MFIEQDYTQYTAAQHRIWSDLYERRMLDLCEQGCRAYLDGAQKICLPGNRMPELAELNSYLTPLTGWQVRAVPGYIPARDFFSCLAVRQFPSTITIRNAEQFNYLPEPDIFHDVFGHVPMHAHDEFGDFLQRLGEAGRMATSEAEIRHLQNLFWFTIEFGLIQEEGHTKLYGSGLVSSPGEGRHALTNAVEKRPFKLEEVIETDFEIDHFQPLLYVIDGFDQLVSAADAFIDGLRHNRDTFAKAS
ncbi:MAG: phenylalanine 4-monooxygenase [Candidatus Sericytochromatia bacterium]|nr:phenylalanine 4-monooxygenase [Candidatus Sericytochromatia bacterium]